MTASDASGVAGNDPASREGAPPRTFNIRQAAFIGIGAMVGAGIFSLLGAAGAVAGAAVWISFLIAGGVALLQGYSFAKFGARYPTAGGLLEYVVKGFGDGHAPGIVAWLLLFANAIVTGMVAVSFGEYASSAVANGSDTWIKIFAIVLILAMTGLNVIGSQAVARLQTLIVYVVIGILTLFSVTTLVNINPHLLAFSGYPPLKYFVSSVALTFFAFLGFGVVTFTAKDLREPSRRRACEYRSVLLGKACARSSGATNRPGGRVECDARRAARTVRGPAHAEPDKVVLVGPTPRSARARQPTR